VNGEYQNVRPLPVIFQQNCVRAAITYCPLNNGKNIDITGEKTVILPATDKKPAMVEDRNLLAAYFPVPVRIIQNVRAYLSALIQKTLYMAILAVYIILANRATAG